MLENTILKGGNVGFLGNYAIKLTALLEIYNFDIRNYNNFKYYVMYEDLIILSDIDKFISIDFIFKKFRFIVIDHVDWYSKLTSKSYPNVFILLFLDILNIICFFFLWDQLLQLIYPFQVLNLIAKVLFFK
jgi:hypothetical protein